jgi:hypothetical protein
MNPFAQVMRTGRGRAVAAAAVLLTAGVASGAIAGMGQASAADGPNGHHQWVQIVAKDNGGWSADMTLYDQNGKAVYTWHENPSGMNTKQTWWYTSGNGYVEGTINEGDGEGGITPHSFRFRYDHADADGNCWLITDSVRYTGDSKTGGCTPD